MRKKKNYWAAQRCLAQNPTLEAQFDKLPKHHELLNPVLRSSRSDAFRTGVKSRVGACLLIQILT